MANLLVFEGICVAKPTLTQVDIVSLIFLSISSWSMHKKPCYVCYSVIKGGFFFPWRARKISGVTFPPVGCHSEICSINSPYCSWEIQYWLTTEGQTFSNISKAEIGSYSPTRYKLRAITIAEQQHLIISISMLSWTDVSFPSIEVPQISAQHLCSQNAGNSLF